MSQSVWHKHDIENVLRGVELSCRQMAAQFDDPETESYRRGFQAALAATATSFGIQIDVSSLNNRQPAHRGSRQIASPPELA